jgi:hypothetical protein
MQHLRALDRDLVCRDYATRARLLRTRLCWPRHRDEVTLAMKDKKSSPRRTLTFDDVREIALSMPEVEEVTAYGMPAFKAGKTRFVGAPVARHDVLPNSIGVPMSFEDRARRLASHPNVYYLTEHFAPYPGVLVRLSSVSRKELREILSAAWQYAMEHQTSAKKPRSKASARRSRVRR